MKKFRSSSRFLLGVSLVLLLLASVADAARQAVPAGGDLSWEYTPTITQKIWNNTNVCTGGWNNSSTGCLGWTNTSIPICGANTYTIRLQQPDFTVNTVDSNGFVENVTLAGTYMSTAAGASIAGGINKFNYDFCFNGSNATTTEFNNLSAEYTAYNVTLFKGKQLKGVKRGAGEPFSYTVETFDESANGREATLKIGNSSINLTFTTATDFNAGVHYRTRVVGGSLELALVPAIYGTQTYDTNDTTNNGSDSGKFTVSNGFANVTNAAQDDNFIASTQITNQTGDFLVRFDMAGTDVDQTNSFITTFVGLGSGPFIRTVGGAAGEGCTATSWCDQDGIEFLSDAIGDVNAVASMIRDGVRQTAFFAQGNNWGDWVIRYFRVERVGTTTTYCMFTSAANRDNNVSAVECIGLSSAVLPVFDRFIHAQGFGGANTVNALTFSIDNAIVGTSDFDSPGSWNSTVLVGGQADFLNFTVTNSSSPASTRWEVWQRSSNTSFTAAGATPAWTLVALSSDANPQGVRVHTENNISAYNQYRINLTGTATATPSIGQFTVNYTLLPNATGALTSNLSFARPYRTWVSFSQAYTDSEGGLARLGVINSTEGDRTCNNATNAAGNSSAFCIFQWNHTQDGVAPSLCGVLTDEDGANNNTNCSTPTTTDNAVPDVQVTALGNTSSPTFTPLIHRRDNSSGLNRTWLNLFNLSNDSLGSTNFSGNVTVAAGNASITLCTTCYGQIRVSAQADDALPVADRFISAFSNRTFYWDPLPILSAAAASPARLDDASGNSNLTVVATENFTSVVAAYVVITAPQGAGTVNRTMTLNGHSRNGTWHFNFVPTVEFGGGAPTGEYRVQFQAHDTGTVDLATVNTTVAFGGTGATGDASGAPGGGGGGGAASSQSSRYGTPAPSPKAQVAGPGPGVACPQLLAQTHIILPQHGAHSTWAWNCRTLSPVSGCDLVGERVEKRKGEDVLTGARDPWWSCSVEAGGIALRYSIPTDQINTSSFFALPVSEPSWNTFAKVTVRENGNSSTFDVRLHVTNAAASVQVPLPGPVVAAFALLAPMSAGAVLLAGVLVAVGWLRVWPGKLAYLWFAAAAGVFFFGLGTVGTAAGGARVGGPLLGWVGYAAFSLLAWGWVRSGQTAKLRAFQRLAGERLAR